MLDHPGADLLQLPGKDPFPCCVSFGIADVGHLIEAGHGSTHIACILQRLLALRREREVASDKTSPACGLYRECATDPRRRVRALPFRQRFLLLSPRDRKKNWFR